MQRWNALQVAAPSGMSPPVSQSPHSAHPQSLVGNRPTPAPGGLPGIIVRVGPPGGDAARAHLDAGHSPDALIEAAANSLAAAAVVNGRLDPARYMAWLQQRVQFLREIPNADALFGSVEAAAHTLAAVMARNSTVGAAPAPAQRQFVPPRSAVQQNALLSVADAAARNANVRR